MTGRIQRVLNDRRDAQIIPSNLIFTQDNFSSVEKHQASDTSVSGTTYQSIFSVADAHDFLGGHVNGPSPDRIRYTWADGTTDEVFAVSRGESLDNADSFASLWLPPATNVIEVEFRSGAAGEYGWVAYSKLVG